MSFGKCLQNAMRDNGVTQEDLAGGIGKKQATVSGYINDKIDPSYSVMKKIASFLEMTVCELISYEPVIKDESDEERVD